MIPTEVSILCWSRPESPDLNFAKVAEFLGLKPAFLTLNADSTGLDYFEKNLPEHPVCLVASGRTVARICSNAGFKGQFKSFLFRRIAYFLIHTVEADQLQTAALNFLSDGALSSISPVDGADAQYRVSSSDKAICRQFAGLCFGPVNPNRDLTFASSGDANGLRPLIMIGSQVFFAALERDECRLFVVGCDTVADIDESVSPALDIRRCFSQLIPVMMFLKHVFKDRAWHAEKPYANFTLDDPLLQKRYGFLDYGKLLETMDSSGFSTSVAFIPWNFKRTDSATAALFRSRPDKFSIAVHGCDHGEAEFNSNDTGLLGRKTREAIRRMHCHQKSTGLPFDRVMIFPQGLFSPAALKALKANNFLAAVNSTAWPASDAEIAVRLRDLLDVAILNYESFPLFVRRYPVDVFGCALDLFLGKPLLLVEHHGYFRHGYEEIADFASRVNALDERISWHGLGYVLDRASLSKTGPGPDRHMKLYAHNAWIAGETEQERVYRISKADANNLRVQDIKLSGKPVPFTRDGDTLTMSLRPAKGANSRLEITFENPWGESDIEYRLLEYVRVFARRHLTEIRDNYIARSESLLSLAYRVTGLGARPQQ